MPYAWRSIESAPCTSATTSFGMRRCSATYSSNNASTRRASDVQVASDRRAASSISSAERGAQVSRRRHVARDARAAMPSTRMRAVPFACRVAWTMRATTPTRCRSPAAGSSVSALRWATRKSRPPSAAAASMAPSDPGGRRAAASRRTGKRRRREAGERARDGEGREGSHAGRELTYAANGGNGNRQPARGPLEQLSAKYGLRLPSSCAAARSRAAAPSC